MSPRYLGLLHARPQRRGTDDTRSLGKLGPCTCRAATLILGPLQQRRSGGLYLATQRSGGLTGPLVAVHKMG